MNSQNIFGKYWEFDSNKTLKIFNTSTQGITEKEIASRRKKFGSNEIKSQKQRSALKILLSQFSSPLLIILLVAALVSGFLGEFFSTTIIILMIIFSAIISFFQEYRSEKTVQLLKKKVALKTQVIRHNKTRQILASDLVVGDIVSLLSGTVIPADLRIIQSDELTINESVLTGESYPVQKNSEPQRVKDFLPQAMNNLAFAGTHVVSGSGLGVVVAVGAKTEFGKTAALLGAQQTPSQFQKGVSDFGIFLFKIIVVFSLMVFLFLAIFRGNWLASLMFSLSIAVGISPELLPLIITINLSKAARLMAKNHVIVKRLMAIENLGNADILCTDKTGTLTEGKVFLRDFFNFEGKKDLKLLTFANLCNCYNFTKADCHNILDDAVIEFVKKNKYGKKLIKEYKFIDDVAFDFDRRRMSAIVQNKERLIITKGADEEMLSVCTHVEINERVAPINAHLKKIKAKIKEQESCGLKTLLLAYREIEVKDKYSTEDEKDLILSGYLVFADPPKKSAAKSLEMFRQMGVHIKLITGDTEESAKFLAKETGFLYAKTISGQKLQKFKTEKFNQAVSDYDIFAKATPELKLRIIKALKEKGHAVAFLGDGINDAPALRQADVGISVDSATDVAKEAADVILLKKNLQVLIGGIIEGRKTFGNTLKYIFCTISSNYGNMFSVVGASILLPFIPLLPVQVLLLNFLSDFPLLAISTDRVDEEYLKKPKQWDIKKIKKFMNYFGLISSAFDFLTFGFLLFIVKASMPLFQVGWFWQSFLTEVLLIFVIRTRKWFFRSRPSNGLITAFLITILIVLAIMYTPLADYFGFAIMPLWVNLTMIAMGFGYFFVVELGKKAFYRKYDI